MIASASFLTFGKVNPGSPQTDIFVGGGPSPPPLLIFVSAGPLGLTFFWGGEGRGGVQNHKPTNRVDENLGEDFDELNFDEIVF